MLTSTLVFMHVSTAHSPGWDENVPYSAVMPRKISKPRPRQGARLAELRKAAKLTQAELADLIGETQQNIAYWEQSDKPPRSDVLPRMAEVLGVRIEALLGSANTPLRKGGPVGRARHVFNEVSRLPRTKQDRVLEFVSALLEQYKREAG